MNKGRICDLFYPATSIEGAPQKHAFVYVPAGYTPERRYPVLYLLHGICKDEREWLSPVEEIGRGECVHIFDRLIAAQETRPFLVVFPNGRTCREFTDLKGEVIGGAVVMTPAVKGFYAFGSELRRDLIPAVEREYSTENTREGRALAGLSMGGIQTLNIGTENLDLFSSLGSFSCGPTTKPGEALGDAIAQSGYPVEVLYLNCGDADPLCYPIHRGLEHSVKERAGGAIEKFVFETVKGGIHDFGVWNEGLERFVRLVFGKRS